MSRFNQSRRRNSRMGGMHEINEINVMPLVDLLLQLFIAVIIFFPVVEYGMNVNLPVGRNETIKDQKTRTLAVDKQGRTFLNDVPMTLQQLHAELPKLAKINPDITILVKADKANNYGAVMEVMAELHAAHITRIALMTQDGVTPSVRPTQHRFAQR